MVGVVASTMVLLNLNGQTVPMASQGAHGEFEHGQVAAPDTVLVAVAKSCVTALCHETMGKERYVHGPVAAGDCVACHTPVDTTSMYNGQEHTFQLAQQGVQLCYMCHERQDTEAVVHYPIQAGLCFFCHDNHQSPNPFRLKMVPEIKLCSQCHPNDKTTERAIHGPVAAGQCGVCHDAHSSPNEYRLVKQGTDLCFSCHLDKQEDLITNRFAHAPIDVDCVTCHDPHTSPSDFQLHRPVPDLCFGCHVDKKDHIMTAKTEHSPLLTGRKCLNCHDSHYANYPKQLQDAPMQLCLQCHDQEQESDDGMLINIKAWLQDNEVWHGPIRQQDCSACHNPHGSDFFRMLKRSFPRKFYAMFAIEQYDLCFGCHEKTLVLDRYTETLTKFRNGDENLHFRHVNQQKGRSCRACHELHASNNPILIRDSVPFGDWQLPNNYVKYQDGGKCSPGCHLPRGYNRMTKVDNPIDYETFTTE